MKYTWHFVKETRYCFNIIIIAKQLVSYERWWRHDMETHFTLLALVIGINYRWILVRKEHYHEALLSFLLLHWTRCWLTVQFSMIWDALTFIWRHCNVHYPWETEPMKSVYDFMLHLYLDCIKGFNRFFKPWCWGLFWEHWNNRMISVPVV